jgi:hypothetical protein
MYGSALRGMSVEQLYVTLMLFAHATPSVLMSTNRLRLTLLAVSNTPLQPSYQSKKDEQ